MSEDHYFTARPASAEDRRTLTVTLAGREFNVETAAGVFSPDHVDLGTSILLHSVPAPPVGRLLDLGCGWGPVALTAALLEPACHVTAIDVNERALDLLRRNVERVGSAAQLAPIEVTTPDAVADDARFEAIWSNPPIRIGKAALHELLGRWIPRLVPGGQAHLVVKKDLGADSLGRWLADQGWGDVERIANSKGFRVLRFNRS